MTPYADLEASVADGRPYYLYRFTEGALDWRFTNRATDWVSPAGAIPGEAEALTWTASALAHGSIVQSGDPRRVDLDLRFPLSDAFARRYLGPRTGRVTSLTLWRGHEQVPDELVAHWKGRVVAARLEGATITLTAESLFTAMHRPGAHATYQRLCRHALYGRGCRLDIEAHLTPVLATARTGLRLTVAEAALAAVGWFRAGILRHAGLMGFIVDHDGAELTLAGRMPELEAAIDDPDTDAVVEIAPGCDLRPETCSAKFANIVNFGGFPAIPGRNPFDGASIV